MTDSCNGSALTVASSERSVRGELRNVWEEVVMELYFDVLLTVHLSINLS